MFSFIILGCSIRLNIVIMSYHYIQNGAELVESERNTNSISVTEVLITLALMLDLVAIITLLPLFLEVCTSALKNLNFQDF